MEKLMSIVVLGQVACFVIFLATDSKIGIYIACILGSAFYGSYFVPFWACKHTILLQVHSSDEVQGDHRHSKAALEPHLLLRSRPQSPKPVA